VVKNQDYVLYLIPSQHSSFYFQLFLCNHLMFSVYFDVIVISIRTKEYEQYNYYRI
jgi:hypothetical protein